MRKRLRILVAVDFSRDSDRALRAVADLARKTEASVTVAHARPFSDLRAAVEQDRGDLVQCSTPALRRGLAAHYQARLEAAGRLAGGVRTRLLRGWPAKAIAREAARGYDLIAIGQRGRGGVRRALFGSTAEELIHRAGVPVLVVRSPSKRIR